MNAIQLVKCEVITKDGVTTITKDKYILSELNVPSSNDVTFEDTEGSTYYLHDLVGKTVLIGKKLHSVGKKPKKKSSFRPIEDDWY